MPVHRAFASASARIGGLWNDVSSRVHGSSGPCIGPVCPYSSAAWAWSFPAFVIPQDSGLATDVG